MKIDPKSTIGGQPAKVVRDMLRRYDHTESRISVEGVLEHLQQNWWYEFVEGLLERGVIDRNARNDLRRYFNGLRCNEKVYGVRVPKTPDFRAPARTLFDYLLAEGYIERDDDPSSKGSVRHKLTIKGAALGMTKFVRRIDRVKAEALLKGALERVAEINTDPDMMYWVTEVRVFGSYVTDTNDLGDVDLAVRCERRRVRRATYDDYREAEQAVLRRVKGRSPYISIHYVEELDRTPEMGGKTVYTFTPPLKRATEGETQCTAD